KNRQSARRDSLRFFCVFRYGVKLTSDHLMCLFDEVEGLYTSNFSKLGLFPCPFMPGNVQCNMVVLRDTFGHLARRQTPER
ncbi:MAG: hypothetical protein IJ083_04720, partial [Clostridia bacterium]|nr:hypothetical protein [Clostridia bacterium]